MTSRPHPNSQPPRSGATATRRAPQRRNSVRQRDRPASRIWQAESRPNLE
jgi:hypothetical protein